MATRTSAEKVKQIIDTDLSDDIIDAYILAANYTITEVLGSDTELSSDHKTELERWLTAHLISATRERQAKEEGAGGAYIKYEGITGEGLKATMYGQQVLAMDTTGKLAVYTGAKKAASIYAVTSFED
jgi:hypothetical protein